MDDTDELLELVFDDEFPLFGEDSVPARVEGTALWLCLFGLEPGDEAAASRLAEAMARCEPACVLLSKKAAVRGTWPAVRPPRSGAGNAHAVHRRFAGD